MSLKEYRSKRNLKKSHEPDSSIKTSSRSLNFCIQKHAATHLHYDFRLEYRGVLLSWAVPKGLSSNPKDKRLAIQVEDHPLEYQYFEGTIPKGNYGAGNVEIWDHGTYSMPNKTTSQEIEKSLSEGLSKGHFAIILYGEKAKGEYIFQKLTNSSKENEWLVIKKDDVYASSEANSSKNPDRETIKKKLAKMPDFISPMLATLIDKPFDDTDWLFEIKWDGFRGLAFINNGKVQLKSRTKHLLNAQFPPISNQLEKIQGQAIFDGEIVVLDEEGKSHFQLIQNYQQDKKGALFYYVFDLLYKDGEDLRERPLIERKEILKKYLTDLALPLIRYSDHITNKGVDFFKEASKNHLEGIIGKKISSTYQSQRSHDWIKCKTSYRQEVVIGGFTAPKGSRKKFGALLVGVYDENKKLNYVGHVGGGFDATLLNAVYAKLKPLIQDKSPFKTEPKPNALVTWVKPRLVCEVSFAEWTKDNSMRQPIFHGLRTDKPSTSVKKEKPQHIPETEVSAPSKKSHELSLTHLDKIYWPKEKYTKGDLIKYYEQIAPAILPYLKDRPIMLHRFPNGISEKGFYQKNIDFSHANGIKTFPVQHENKTDSYLLIDDISSLLYAVNLGSIDIHPFLSRCEKLEYPDYCVIDLDPHEIAFEKVIEAALCTHQLLEEFDVVHFCKTSGGKGLHILIPLLGKYNYDQSRQFAEIIAFCVHQKLPKSTSLERDPKKRPKKIYLDCLQNRFAQTIVSPYSVRPRPGALVSTPLAWDEINKDLDPGNFTIKTVVKRVEKKGDILKSIFKKGANLKTILKKLQNIIT
jgi:bifunctional non-homologous end joining protein LigD